jgi:hypothetical protein
MFILLRCFSRVVDGDSECLHSLGCDSGGGLSTATGAADGEEGDRRRPRSETPGLRRGQGVKVRSKRRGCRRWMLNWW